MEANKIKIYPYKQGSQSALNLAIAMGVKVLKRRGSKFKPEAGKMVVNWGSTVLPEDIMEKCAVLNHPDNVAMCSDKLRFFENFCEEARLPPHTTDIEVAKLWVNKGKVVFCRTVLNGHSGEGIVVAVNEQEVVPAPLYTRYVLKKDEYRVHFVGGEIVLIQRKARKEDVPDDQVNWRIRNLAGGFVFAKNEEIIVPNNVCYQAHNIIAAAGLDFGAIDIIYNQASDKAYVLEVNTAPGLVGTTQDVYAEKLTKLIEARI